MVTQKQAAPPRAAENHPAKPRCSGNRSPGLRRLSLLILALTGLVLRLSAQVQATSSSTAVITAEIRDALPPKPAALTYTPIARLETELDGPYARPMSSYLVMLFKRAGRPQITEGDNFSHVVRATILTPPTLSMGASSGGKFNVLKSAKKIGNLFGGAKIPDIPENLDVSNTNVIWEARCSVELRLLDKQKNIIEQSKVEVVRTNSLRALSAELNGFRVGGGSTEDVSAFVQNLTKTAVFEALVNLAAYHAALGLLPAADKHFLAAGPSPVAEVPAPSPAPAPAPPTPTPPAETPGTVARGAFCSKCGSKMVADAKFCSGCGSKVAP